MTRKKRKKSKLTSSIKSEYSTGSNCPSIYKPRYIYRHYLRLSTTYKYTVVDFQTTKKCLTAYHDNFVTNNELIQYHRIIQYDVQTQDNGIIIRIISSRM